MINPTGQFDGSIVLHMPIDSGPRSYEATKVQRNESPEKNSEASTSQPRTLFWTFCTTASVAA